MNKQDPWAAAKPPGTKPDAPKVRNYIGDAIVALGSPCFGTSVGQNQHLLAAIIIAQALDRASAKMVEAAAIGRTRS
jgi:hypothetical protein